jgi:hypothetical protein
MKVDVAVEERRMIVEVAGLCDVDEMDAEDRDTEGNCAIDGAYRIVLAGSFAEREDLVDAVLDVFHASVPISCLDDFDILVRAERPEDAGTDWLRRDLGRHHEVPALPGPDLAP